MEFYPSPPQSQEVNHADDDYSMHEVWHPESRSVLEGIGQTVPIQDLGDSDPNTESPPPYAWNRPPPARVRDLNIVNCLGSCYGSDNIQLLTVFKAQEGSAKCCSCVYEMTQTNIVTCSLSRLYQRSLCVMPVL